MLYKSREAITKLVNDYSSVVSEAKSKPVHEKRIPSMSARVARGKVSEKLNLKILTLKQMLQRLPIALAQVRAGNTCENVLSKLGKIIYSLYQGKEITKIV